MLLIKPVEGHPWKGKFSENVPKAFNVESGT